MIDPVIAGIAISISGLLLALRTWRDPMRLRVIARGNVSGEAGWRPIHRRLLTGGALLPGGALLALGQASIFIVWLGALLACGWLCTAVAAPRRHPDH